MLAISQTHISFMFNPQDSRPRTCQPPGKQVSQSSCKHEKKWVERNPRALRSSIVKVTSHCGEIGSTKLHHSFLDWHVLASKPNQAHQKHPSSMKHVQKVDSQHLANNLYSLTGFPVFTPASQTHSQPRPVAGHFQAK